ncbi:MAG: hypothetical protein AAB288_02195, partial [Acidobacteriota bacterium]
MSGGGPPDTQSFVPPDAIIDITSDINLTAGTVTTSNVLLRVCSGADQTTATTACGSSGSPTVGSQLCTSVAYSGDTARIISCEHAVLATDKWHDFRVTTGVTASDSHAVAADVVRRFKTSSF